MFTTLDLLVLSQTFSGDIVRQVNRRATSLGLFRFVKGAGKNVAWPIEGDGQVAETYNEGADVTVFGADEQDSATLPWGLYRAPLAITSLAADGASTSHSPAANQNAWARQQKNAVRKLASLVNRDFYVGTGANRSIVGLDYAIGDVANIYATKDRAIPSNYYWRPNVFDPGTPTALTLPMVRRDLGHIYDASGEVPQVGLCSTDVYNTLGGLFDQNRRYTQNVQGPDGMIKLQAGFDAIEFEGCSFIKDKDAPANSIYYCNNDEIEFEYLPPAELVPMLNAIREQLGDGYRELPLGIVFEMLAKTGAAEKAMGRSTLQLKVKRPNACGVRRNILNAA